MIDTLELRQARQPFRITIHIDHPSWRLNHRCQSPSCRHPAVRQFHPLVACHRFQLRFQLVISQRRVAFHSLRLHHSLLCRPSLEHHLRILQADAALLSQPLHPFQRLFHLRNLPEAHLRLVRQLFHRPRLARILQQHPQHPGRLGRDDRERSAEHPVQESAFTGVGPARDGDREPDLVEAAIKVEIDGRTRLCAAEGHGPIDALSRALTDALTPSFPALKELQLTDYKVRVVDSADGTAAKVRVLIDFAHRGRTFGTVGVSENIIAASWQALVEGIAYAIG